MLNLQRQGPSTRLARKRVPSRHPPGPESPMPLLPAEVQDRFRASFLGFGIGDALGFPFRGASPRSISRLPILADDFAPRPRAQYAKGQFSDDTQLLLATAESVLLEGKVDGRSVAAHLAWLWREGIVLEPPATLTETAEQLLKGTPWMSAGARMGVRDPSALSRALVVGLWNARRPDRLPHEASLLSVITHKDPVCAAASAALARAVSLGLGSERLTPAAFCAEVATAASHSDVGFAEELSHLPRLLTWDTARALSQLRRVSVAPAALRGVEGLPAHVAPVLLTAFYAALKVPNDFKEALSLVLRCGGEVDVAAAVCGGILGAHLGTGAIPPRLRKNLLYAEHLQLTADRLFERMQVREVVIAAVSARARR